MCSCAWGFTLAMADRWGVLKRKSKSKRKGVKTFLSSECLVFSPISLHTRLPFFTRTRSLSPTPTFLLWISNTNFRPSLLISTPTYTHQCPEPTFSLSLSLFHIFIPVASPPPSHRYTHPHTKTTPHSAICRLCASLCYNFFLVTGSYLLQKFHICFWGDFTTSHLAFTSVWTNTFCSLILIFTSRCAVRHSDSKAYFHVKYNLL